MRYVTMATTLPPIIIFAFQLISTQSAAIVTINANTSHVTKEDDTILPIAKKPRLATISEAPPSVPKQHMKSPPSSSNTGFSTNEVSTLKQLIQGVS